MDKIINGQFQRVEKALSTLINSIATYNPNPALALDLVAADQELSCGLEQLAAHQKNHARLVALRNTSAELDGQIRDSLSLLATTRTELLATPATTFSSNTNPVSYSELLSYARRISKTTRPPTFREDEAEPIRDTQSQELDIKIETPGASAEVRTNGTATPIISNGVLPTPMNGTERTSSTPVAEGETGIALPAEMSNWLNPMTGQPSFVPWPTEETIRRGALASIQILLAQGVDPATFDPERSAELEAERRRQEEEAEFKRAEAEAERQRVEMERRARMEQQRRESIAAGGPVQEDRKPAVFTGLDLLDDMDDDDD